MLDIILRWLISFAWGRAFLGAYLGRVITPPGYVSWEKRHVTFLSNPGQPVRHGVMESKRLRLCDAQTGPMDTVRDNVADSRGCVYSNATIEFMRDHRLSFRDPSGLASDV